MSNFLQDGVAWLADQLQEYVGTEVIYCSNVLEIPLTATVALQQYEVMTEEGFPANIVVRDYIFRRSELVLGGLAQKPRPGDEIRETIAGTEHVFSVLPLGSNRPCWEWLDRDGLMIVVHSKQTES